MRVRALVKKCRWSLVAILIAAAAAPVAAFTFLTGRPTWPGSIVMHLQLGSAGTLSDGCGNWGACAEQALSFWNSDLPPASQFRVIQDSNAPMRDANGINNVFFSSTVYDEPFDTSTLAVTLLWRRGTTLTDADVIFNTRFSWNSYRGSLRPSLQDFRRVAIHEFGHVAGLDHPDEAGQSVVAIMNSRVSNTEVPQADDSNGVRALYPSTGPPPTPVQVSFPPRNDSLQFRGQLEAKYRDGLRRGPSQTFVDNEGSVVWTQEYLRYRVNACSHTGAVTRVFMQIDGLGVQPICGTAATAIFPPRNEPFDFRLQLESKYRDGLRRGSAPTFVDVEGDIVWTTEYITYRVNRCTHAQAVDRVLQQIDGRALLPAC